MVDFGQAGPTRLEDVMRCQTCGEDLREGARFCPTCGTPSQPTAAPAAPTVQIRCSGGESVAGPPPAESVPAPVSRAPEPTARPARDPGAGYDPVGPTRPATQAPPRPVVTASAGGAGGSTMMAGLTTPTSGDFRTLFERLQRLARLDTSVFAEVYADTAATIPVAVLAAVVFVISGLGGMLYIASGIGFDVYGRIAQSSGEFFLRSVIIGTIFGIAM